MEAVDGSQRAPSPPTAAVAGGGAPSPWSRGGREEYGTQDEWAAPEAHAAAPHPPNHLRPAPQRHQLVPQPARQRVGVGVWQAQVLVGGGEARAGSVGRRHMSLRFLNRGSGAYGGRLRILADSRRLAQPTAPRVHARVRSGVPISISISSSIEASNQHKCGPLGPHPMQRPEGEHDHVGGGVGRGGQQPQLLHASQAAAQGPGLGRHGGGHGGQGRGAEARGDRGLCSARGESRLGVCRGAGTSPYSTGAGIVERFQRESERDRKGRTAVRAATAAACQPGPRPRRRPRRRCRRRPRAALPHLPELWGYCAASRPARWP